MVGEKTRFEFRYDLMTRGNARITEIAEIKKWL